jgi:AbrB family looped-hinge helix DNA binding protein
MNYSSAIDKRGRITVPREVRRRLGLSAGDRVEFRIESEPVVFHPATSVFEKYRGVLGNFPGGEKGIIEWIRDMRDE